MQFHFTGKFVAHVGTNFGFDTDGIRLGLRFYPGCCGLYLSLDLERCIDQGRRRHQCAQKATSSLGYSILSLKPDFVVRLGVASGDNM